MTQCTAKSKRTHKQCTRPAMKGKAVCYHHGGKTPGVKGNINAKTHGAYAKTLNATDKAAHDAIDLDTLDAEIRRNAGFYGTIHKCLLNYKLGDTLNSIQ